MPLNLIKADDGSLVPKFEKDKELGWVIKLNKYSSYYGYVGGKKTPLMLKK